MSEQPTARRVIEVKQHVIGPPEPRLKNVRARKLSDYPHLPAAYRDAAKVYSSPLLMGPPICDELIAFLQHLYTEEEAGAVRHLHMVRGRTAAQVARAEHRPVEDVEPILKRLADEKHCIAANVSGTRRVPLAADGTRSVPATETADGTRRVPDTKRQYRLLPIMPGVFEMVLFDQSPETITPWHRRFAELFEALYETGYSLDYGGAASNWVRFLPVGRAIEAHPLALPSDHLAVVLDQFDSFGVGQCQCRHTAQIKGEGCGRPLGNCMVMGQWAEHGIQEGRVRRVTKEEALEIKREAESLGMVNWVMNVASTKGQCSCSCCGCCCHAMRMVNEFNAPALSAPPHFLPRVDLAKCTYCGRCARNCPMAAIAVDTQGKTYKHLEERCIGCGQCAVACDAKRAISMEAVPEYKLPYRSWFALLTRTMPGMLMKSWQVWRGREH